LEGAKWYVNALAQASQGISGNVSS